MTVTCEIIEGNYQTETGVVTGYGLAFYRAGGAEAVCRIEDITCDRAELAELRARINASDLDEVHIMEVLDNALVEWEAVAR